MPLSVTETIQWGHDALSVVLDVAPSGPVGVRSMTAGPGSAATAATQPLVELLIAGSGRARASERFADTAIGRRLRYLSSDQTRDRGWHNLRVLLRDDVTGLVVEVFLRSMDGVSACQSWATVTNRGTTPALLLAVTSFAAGFRGHAVDDLDAVSVKAGGSAARCVKRASPTSTWPCITRTAAAASPSPAPAPGRPARTCPRAVWSIGKPGMRCCGRSSTTARGAGRSASGSRARTRPCSAPRISTISGRRRCNRDSRSRRCRRRSQCPPPGSRVVSQR